MNWLQILWCFLVCIWIFVATHQLNQIEKKMAKIAKEAAVQKKLNLAVLELLKHITGDLSK